MLQQYLNLTLSLPQADTGPNIQTKLKADNVAVGLGFRLGLGLELGG